MPIYNILYNIIVKIKYCISITATRISNRTSYLRSRGSSYIQIWWDIKLPNTFIFSTPNYINFILKYVNMLNIFNIVINKYIILISFDWGLLISKNDELWKIHRWGRVEFLLQRQFCYIEGSYTKQSRTP